MDQPRPPVCGRWSPGGSTGAGPRGGAPGADFRGRGEGRGAMRARSRRSRRFDRGIRAPRIDHVAARSLALRALHRVAPGDGFTRADRDAARRGAPGARRPHRAAGCDRRPAARDRHDRLLHGLPGIRRHANAEEDRRRLSPRDSRSRMARVARDTQASAGWKDPRRNREPAPEQPHDRQAQHRHRAEARPESIRSDHHEAALRAGFPRGRLRQMRRWGGDASVRPPGRETGGRAGRARCDLLSRHRDGHSHLLPRVRAPRARAIHDVGTSGHDRHPQHRLLPLDAARRAGRCAALLQRAPRGDGKPTVVLLPAPPALLVRHSRAPGRGRR
jgi:hypothetical protein